MRKADSSRKGKAKVGFNCLFCNIDQVLKELWDIQYQYPKTFKNESYRHARLQHQIRMTGPIEYCRTEILRSLEFMAKVCIVNSNYARALKYCRLGLREIDPNHMGLRAMKKQAKRLMTNKAAKKGRAVK